MAKPNRQSKIITLRMSEETYAKIVSEVPRSESMNCFLLKKLGYIDQPFTAGLPRGCKLRRERLQNEDRTNQGGEA